MIFRSLPAYNQSFIVVIDTGKGISLSELQRCWKDAFAAVSSHDRANVSVPRASKRTLTIVNIEIYKCICDTRDAFSCQSREGTMAYILSAVLSSHIHVSFTLS